MSTWTELRATLLRVVDEHPDALHVYPGPSTAARHDEPWEIHLAAWALDVAADLHERFGDAVELKVGAMHYPQQRLRRPPPSLKELVPAESCGIRTRLPRPLAIASGHGVRCEVVIGNGTSDRVVLSATGGLLGSVVTDDEGEVSAEDTGPTQSSLVTFGVEPHTELAVPTWVGTESLRPELGYALPAGRWWLVACLDVGETATLRSSAMPFTITP
ncbi:MAG TPA: hypothetical protein VFJ19_12465 [Nocardioidaceae bacterium]|nr:hypothetical protein [Nocardioidaceae bacterium]